MPSGLFLFFLWWSLAPDLRFSLGPTNTRRVFRYTGKGFYLGDRSIFYTPGGGGGKEQRRGLMPLGLFLLVFLVVACPRPLLGQNNTCQ